MAVAYHRGDTWFAGWVSEYATGPSTASADETVVPLNLPVRTAAPQPSAAIEIPSSGAVLRQPFTVEGWAIDRGGPDGCGVDAVHLYAHAAGNALPMFLGAARYGTSSPDDQTQSGQRFRACGWSIAVSGLSPGTYRLAAHPHDTVTGAFTAASVVTVVVR
jgi:hypothetical protein